MKTKTTIFMIAMLLMGLALTSMAQSNEIAPPVSKLFSGSKWPVYPMINSGKTYVIQSSKTDDTTIIATLMPSKEKNMWYILQNKNNSLYVTGHIKIEGSAYFVYENNNGKMSLVNKTSTY